MDQVRVIDRRIPKMDSCLAGNIYTPFPRLSMIVNRVALQLPCMKVDAASSYGWSYYIGKHRGASG